MALLELRLLGPMQVHREGKAVAGFASNKVRALLAYLAGEAPRPQFREQVAELLWPGWPKPSAGNNLRFALADLRKRLGDRDARPPFLSISRESLTLNLESDLWVDTAAFCKSITRAELGDPLGWQAAVDLYLGPFLEGFALADNPDFAEWLLGKRAYYQRQVLKALRELALRGEQAGDYEGGLRYARRQLEIEPWLEEAHQQVMRLLALNGQRGAALAHYEECRRILAKDLGVEPSADTRRLVEMIREGVLHGEEAPRAQPAPKRNLPLPLTSFIGREKHITEVHRLLVSGPSRLVTLTGAGGVGKTRLALRVAEEAQADFPHGAWWVDLSALEDVALLPELVADAFGLQWSPSRPADAVLRDFLPDQALLLVLDTCEHLIHACARLSKALLQAAPRLRILATSRELLGVEGETAYRVPSLDIPDPGAALSLVDLLKCEGIALFTERARAALPEFALTEANAAAVVEICRRVDGIPLAVELAAARVRMMSVEQIAARLNDAFHLLTGGSRTALPRHQTLRALIDWSYDLLPEDERALLVECSVFSGGWTLEAAEAVCSGEDVLRRLGRLVDKSLVNVAGGQANRFRLLDTIRQYAREKLDGSGAAGQLRDRHLACFLSLAERLAPGLRARTQVEYLDQIEQDLPNLRAALDWGLQTSLEPALRLASALTWFWHYRSYQQEGLSWQERGIAHAGFSDLPVEVRAKSLASAGFHAAMVYNLSRSRALLEDSLRIYRALGEAGKPGAAEALRYLSHCEYSADRYELGERYSRESLALSQETGSQIDLAESLAILCWCLWNQDIHSQETRQLMEQNLAIRLQLGDVDGIATAYRMLGLFTVNQSNLKSARHFFQQSLSFYQQVGNQAAVGDLYQHLTIVAILEGSYPKAAGYVQKALAIHHRIGNFIHEFNDLSYGVLLYLIDGKNELARRYIEDALACAEKTGLHNYIGLTHVYAGMLAWIEGDRPSADRAFAEAWDHIMVEQNPAFIQLFKYYKGRILCLDPGNQEAPALLKESVLICAGCNDYMSAGFLLDALACLAVDRQPERAAGLFGAAERMSPHLVHILLPVQRAQRETALANLRASLGEARVAALYAEGAALSLPEALQYALTYIEGSAPPPPP